MDFKIEALLLSLTVFVCFILWYLGSNLIGIAVDQKNEAKAELDAYISSGYAIMIKDNEATRLPEDWHNWVYVVNDEDKTISFIEYKDDRGARTIPVFISPFLR